MTTPTAPRPSFDKRVKQAFLRGGFKPLQKHFAIAGSCSCCAVTALIAADFDGAPEDRIRAARAACGTFGALTMARRLGETNAYVCGVVDGWDDGWTWRLLAGTTPEARAGYARGRADGEAAWQACQPLVESSDG
jgi:hypothetical protein